MVTRADELKVLEKSIRNAGKQTMPHDGRKRMRHAK
jgi:hypothetical protein